MNDTLIIGAMAQEVRRIHEAMTRTEEVVFGPRAATTGELDGVPVVLAKSGVGKVLAAAAAEALIARFAPKAIIFTGIAGALNPAYEVGDTVIAADTVQHDMDASAAGFPIGQIPYTEHRFVTADPALLAAARSYAPASGRLHEGRVLTGDRFIARMSPEQDEHLLGELAGDAVEMEGASVATVAAIHGVPFLLVRTISDRADGTAQADFKRFLPVASENSLAVVRHVLSQVSQIGGAE